MLRHGILPKSEIKTGVLTELTFLSMISLSMENARKEESLQVYIILSMAGISWDIQRKDSFSITELSGSFCSDF